MQKINISKGYNSYTVRPIITKLCMLVELNNLNISSSKSFSLSVTVVILKTENIKKYHFSLLKGNNSYKCSSDNFDPMETFVELLIMKSL